MRKIVERRELRETHVATDEVVTCDGCGQPAPKWGEDRAAEAETFRNPDHVRLANLKGWFVWVQMGTPGAGTLADNYGHFCPACAEKRAP